MTLNIELNADYKITSDSRNIIVNRRAIVDPTKSPNWKRMEAEGASPALREEWREVSYHATVPQAIAAIGEQQVRDSEAETLAELLAEIHDFRGEIESQMCVEGNCKWRG